MPNKRNYQKELDQFIAANCFGEDNRPGLLLHACCAPCSSYVLEYLSRFFRITVFYYNPNITERAEYVKRTEEIHRLAREMEEKGVYAPGIVAVEDGVYEPEKFLEFARDLADVPEGGERCYKCYELRMRETCKYAKEHGFQFFTTTLSISPLKNVEWINEIGERLAEEYGISHLPSEFRKKNGYKRSIELSKEYELYRQDYCGCAYSKRERELCQPNQKG